MKKLITALVVLALVLTMAPAVLAEGGTYYTTVDSITIAEGDIVEFYLDSSVYGQTLTIENAAGLTLKNGLGGGMIEPDASNTITLTLEQNSPAGCYLALSTTNTEATTYTLSWGAAPVLGDGSELDPYQSIGSYVNIPAGQTVYFALGADKNGKQLVIYDMLGEITVGGLMGAAYDPNNGTTAVTLQQNRPMGIMFSLSSSATEDKEYYVEILDPIGSASNPEKITALPSAVTCYMMDGAYVLEYTAEEAGYLTVNVTDNWGSTDYEVEAYSSGVGSKWVSDSENKDTLTVGVMAYGTVTITAMTFDYTAGLDLSFSWTPATEGEQIKPIFGELDEDRKLTTPEIPAGATVYFDIMGIAGSVVTIDDADATIWHNYSTYPAKDGAPISSWDSIIAITNNGTTAKTFTLVSVIPVGTYENPEEVTDLSEIEFDLEEGNDQGYYYTYTAGADGKVVLELKDAALAGKVNLILFNSTSFESASLIYWDDATSQDVVGDTVTLDVAAGDVVSIYLTIVPDANYNYAAAAGAFGTPEEPAKTGDDAMLSTAAVLMVVAAAAFVTLKRKAI